MIDHILKSPAPFIKNPRKRHVPVIVHDEASFKSWLLRAPEAFQTQIGLLKFKADNAQCFVSYNNQGEIESVIAGVEDRSDLYNYAAISAFLLSQLSVSAIKAHSFYFDNDYLDDTHFEMAAIGWGLGTYQFDLYKDLREPVKLYLSDVDIKTRALAFVEATVLVRKLVHTPSNAMGPDELEFVARDLAKSYKAEIEVIQDGALLDENFPLVYTVGAASPRRPRLIDIKWGKKSHPAVTLVGKGVCYDTGGLNLKPGQYMKDMKKDMGGAAHVLGLARLIMSLKVPVCLRVLVPAVENAVAGEAFRPGDVIKSRDGTYVENTNTDAEGRLILADSLAYASEEKTDLIIDFATLTGSARAALGPDIPACFSSDDDLGAKIQKLSFDIHDPVWIMPLWDRYNKQIESSTGDIVNSAGLPGDLIYSALFLKHFVKNDARWMHFDCYAWEASGKAGRPKGGSDTGLRAAFALIESMYGKK